jgi:hypothetical protein
LLIKYNNNNNVLNIRNKNCKYQQILAENMAGMISNEIRKYTILAFEINIMWKFKKIEIVRELSRNIQILEFSVKHLIYL